MKLPSTIRVFGEEIPFQRGVFNRVCRRYSPVFQTTRITLKICPKCQTKFKEDESFCSKDGTKLEYLGEKKGGLANQVLNDSVRLDRFLTADAMAERYLGVLLGENQPTSVTVFNQKFIPIAEAKKRMETARLLVGAPLPKEINIALRSNFEYTPPYIIHSVPAGRSVRELLDQKERLPWELAAKIIASTARVLEWLHEHGILFRAIHPGAIFVSDIESGKVQLAEWAYDSLMDIDSPLAALKKNPNAFVGHVNYLAPELAVDFQQGDVRSTVYALGILLYEMITGVAPMQAATSAETLSRHKLEKPLPIHLAAPNTTFHPDLGEIIDRMLSKKKTNRFQAPGAIISVLSNLLDVSPLDLAPKLRRSEMRENELFQTIDMESVDRKSIPDLAPLEDDRAGSQQQTAMMHAIRSAEDSVQTRESPRKDTQPSIEVDFGDDAPRSVEVNFDPLPVPAKPLPLQTIHSSKPISEEVTEKRKRDVITSSQHRALEEAAKKREDQENAKKAEAIAAEKKRKEIETSDRHKALRLATEEAKKRKEIEKEQKVAELREIEAELKDTTNFDKKNKSNGAAKVSVSAELHIEPEEKPEVETALEEDSGWFSESKDEAWERSLEREDVEETKTQQKKIGLAVFIAALLFGILAFVYFEYVYEAEVEEVEVVEAASNISGSIPKSKEAQIVHLAKKFSEAIAANRLVTPLGDSGASYLEELGILEPDSDAYQSARIEFFDVVLEKSESMSVDKAINLVREAQKLDPGHKKLKARFKVLNAEYSGNAKEPETEEQAAEKAKIEALIKKAKSQLRDNESDAARESYLEAYAITSADHRVTGGLGMIYFDEANYAKSVGFFKKAIARSGKVSYRISLGRSYFRLGRYESALKAWKNAQKIAPKNKRIKRYMGMAERKLK